MTMELIESHSRVLHANGRWVLDMSFDYSNSTPLISNTVGGEEWSGSNSSSLINYSVLKHNGYIMFHGKSSFTELIVICY